MFDAFISTKHHDYYFIVESDTHNNCGSISLCIYMSYFIPFSIVCYKCDSACLIHTKPIVDPPAIPPASVHGHGNNAEDLNLSIDGKPELVRPGPPLGVMRDI